VPDPTAAVVAEAIERFRFRYSSEDQLQEGLAGALAAAGIVAEREVRLGPRDRIDLLAGRVGIEVKVKGAASDVARQLARYASSDRVDELVLVTTRSSHWRVPRTVNGKPVVVVPARFDL
jgi:hypothetical protein